MTRPIHPGAVGATDPAQSTAIVDFLRHRDTRPFAADPNQPLPDAVATLWVRVLRGATESPRWEPLPLGESFDRPVTALSARVPECPDLTLLALAMPIAASRHLLAVVFASTRPCTAEAGRHNVVAIQDDRDLAQALLASAVDGRVDHAKCRPSHGDGVACWRLNQADESRAAEADGAGLTTRRH